MCRKWWDVLAANFESACRVATDNFSLIIEKYPRAGVEQWIGIFEAEGKRLRLFGMLDPEG